MDPVKVVLASYGVGPDNLDLEVELGPFRQGVTYKHRDRTAPLSLYDVASDSVIARCLPGLGWIIEGEQESFYNEAIVQHYEMAPAPQEGLNHANPRRQREISLALMERRYMTISLPLPLERRARHMLKRIDETEPEPYEKDDRGEYTDEALQHVILGCADRGLEIGEREAGEYSTIDGLVRKLPGGGS